MNWSTTIAAARARGHFTDDEADRAAGWVTCACGEQDARIPRMRDPFWGPRDTGPEACPVDPDLQALGMSFTQAVNRNDFDAAEITLEAIEARAAVVLENTLAMSGLPTAAEWRDLEREASKIDRRRRGQ